MLTTVHNRLHFAFPEIHPDAKLVIEFQRTLRIPDDGKEHRLPPGLGTFPLKHVDDHADRVPLDWKERGGVMLPMYQSEALWVNFQPHPVYRRQGISSYPFAVKVAAGMCSAVTGDPWRKKLKKGDYVTVPKQPWLDGFVVEKGVVKQFVAMPLGHGFTAEEQLTGKAEFGGIQIEVYPMKADEFEARFPKRPPPQRRRSYARSRMKGGGQRYGAAGLQGITRGIDVVPCAASADMGLGAGGSMKQEIFADPYGKKVWKKKGFKGNRVYVHLANSIAWKAITTEDPPHQPPTAADYTRRGLPWFDHYDDGPVVKGSAKLKGLKSVLELGYQKGVPGLIENESLPHKPKPHQTGPKKRPKKKQKDQVRDGAWAE